MIISAEKYVEHHGVKGMKWGHRKQRTKEERSRRNKRIAVVLGTAATAAAIAGGAYFIKKRLNVPTSSIGPTSATSKKFAETLAEEPMALLHSSRGRNRDYAFLQGGGLKDVESEFIKSGLPEASAGYFKRYGDQSEKLAVRFLDPEGRKDFSGRPISHDVIFPKSMAKDIHDVDQARDVAWPTVKKLYEVFFESAPNVHGPAY